MTLTAEAVYTNGRLEFNHPVDLAEGTPVRVTITPLADDGDFLADVIGKVSSGRTDGAANHDKYLYGKRP